jgi:Na+/H+-dicarboxylate symporter
MPAAGRIADKNTRREMASMMRHGLTTLIFAAFVVGILVGYVVNEFATSEWQQEFATYVSLLTDIFLRLIKMIIAPLVFSTLVAGIAHMGSGSTVGRVGLKAIGWFLLCSVISLSLGLILVNILQPGFTLHLPLPAGVTDTGIKSTGINIKDFVAHMFPRSMIEAMATNEILQIVVFSAFFGIACAALGERARAVVTGVEELSHIMLRVTNYVMLAAPLAVFAAIAAIIAKQGLSIIQTYGIFIAEFYGGILLLWVVLCLLSTPFIGARILTLLRMIKEPMVLAFSTASSEAAYPKTLEQLERFGASPKVASFVLPLGYSFNLDGSMMYCTFAAVFIAQAYGIELTAGQQITMMLILMLTSKGMAGVPRASLVVIAATLQQFKIPEAGLLLIFGIDQVLDMARSATNVLGNSIAAAVVSRWEGVLGPVREDVEEAELDKAEAAAAPVAARA